MKIREEVSAIVTRGPESWQFFAFVFAAIVTLALTLVDEIPSPRWRIVAKIVAFFVMGYLTLVNVRVRNTLVRLLGAFKKERH